MPIALAQVNLRHSSGLAEDTVVNTFHFDGFDFPGDVVAIQAAIVAFYNDLQSTNKSVASYLSSQLSGIAETKFYSLSDPVPRVPRATIPWALVGHGGPRLPSEVALCLSYHAVFESGQPNAQRRGRVYIGPLNQDAWDSNSGRPVANVLTTLRNAADDLRLTSVAAGAPWSVYSRVGNDAHAIVGGWTDNAFDTQRRRGERATARQLWPA
jgi:hypothetical protein